MSKIRCFVLFLLKDATHWIFEPPEASPMPRLDFWQTAGYYRGFPYLVIIFQGSHLGLKVEHEHMSDDILRTFC